MKFDTIQSKRRRLADEVYEQLIAAIMAREIGPDDTLVQEKLAADMQISRTPVREALMRLEQEGVLEVSRRGSFRLYQMDDQEVRELYQSRAAVEGQCARILAVHHTPQQIAELRETIEREENISERSARSYFEANRNIHRAFVQMSENRFLLEMFDMIWGKAMAFHLFATIESIDLNKSLGDHVSLVDAVERGDKAEVLEVFIDHIHDGFDLQMEGLKASR